MDCARVNRKIELYVLSDLPYSEQAAIAEHLASCPACRAACDRCRFVVAQIKGSARRDSPRYDFTFAQEVRSAVKEEIHRVAYRTLAWRVITVVGSVAACLLMALIGWEMWVSSSSKLESMLAKDSPRQLHMKVSAAVPVLEAWQHNSTPSAPGSTTDSVVVHGQNMYLLQTHDGQNYVASLDTQTRRQKWLSDIQSCGYFLADELRVYCLSPDGLGGLDLLALDANDGRLLWRHRQERADKLHSPCRPSLLPRERICWTSNGAVHVLSRTDGNSIWTCSIPDKGKLSAAVAIDDDLFVANGFGLYCLDATTGDISWRLACGDIKSGQRRPMLATADGHIYVSMSLGLRSSRLFCMDPVPRKILWSRVVDCAARLDAVGDVLYVRDQSIRAIEGATGRLLWTCPAKGCNPVTYVGDLAYFVDSKDQGRLVALDRYTGAKVWELAGIKSCDAFIKVNGTGFLKTTDGVVHAIIFKG